MVLLPSIFSLEQDLFAFSNTLLSVLLPSIFSLEQDWIDGNDYSVCVLLPSIFSLEQDLIARSISRTTCFVTINFFARTRQNIYQNQNMTQFCYHQFFR